MKQIAVVLTASFLSLAVAGAGSATSTDPAPKKETSRSEPQRQAWMPDANAMESSKLVGTKVKNEQGKEIGEINQLIVDHPQGKITHVILSKGGVLGVGDQKLVLPWSDLKFQREGDRKLVAMVDQSKVDGAPRYEARRDTTPAASPATSPSSSSPPKQDKKQ